MFCTQCGKQIDDNSQFCPNCGSKTVLNDISNSNQILNDASNTIPFSSNASTDSNPPLQKSTNKSHKRTPLIVAAILIAGVSFIGIKNITSPDYNTPQKQEYAADEVTPSPPEESVIPQPPSVLPAWCSGAYYGNDIYSKILFNEQNNTFDVFIYRLVGIENCIITEQDDNQIVFTGNFDIDVGSVSGVLSNYGGDDLTLTITESDWSMLPSGTTMEFYYDYQDPNYANHNNCENIYEMCGIYASPDIPANRVFIWENGENFVVSLTNRSNSIDVFELSSWDIDRANDITYFSAYTIQTGEEIFGSHDPQTGTLSITLGSTDSMLSEYGFEGLFFKQS